jgi:hypothetical protein
MKSISIILLAFAVGTTLACSTPQEKAYKAQEKVHKERLKLVEEYKKCLKKAGDDKEKIEACDQYLRAAEALK